MCVSPAGWSSSPARGASSRPLEDRGIIWLRVPPSTLFVVNSSSLQAAGHEASCHGSMARLRLFVMRLNCRKSVPQEAVELVMARVSPLTDTFILYLLSWTSICLRIRSKRVVSRIKRRRWSSCLHSDVYTTLLTQDEFYLHSLHILAISDYMGQKYDTKHKHIISCQSLQG